ncbi:MAG TPA: nucleoside-diphosphate sugar epimerase/dehydratase [Acetobacteraceae bacterium]|nr:nucleoside-diphosphate sugar epimerase/dehydratase [Acetobacteraceae bacterium]
MPSQRSVNRILLNILHDGVLAAAAVPLARWIAAPGVDPFLPARLLADGAASLLIAGLPFRLPLQYWRFAGIRDLLAVSGASVLAAALLALLMAASGTAPATPTFPIVFALVLGLVLGSPRVLYRLLQGYRATADAPAGPTPIVLVGADEAADLFLRATARDRGAGLRVLGLISLGSRQTGRRIHGHPILGGLDDAGLTLDRLRAEDRAPAMLVVTDPDLSGEALARLLEAAELRGIQVRRARPPTRLDPAATAAAGVELRPVAIEDLLNRPQVPLDRAGMARLVQGRRVLVTGAGGTIGSELARQVAGLGPSMLALLDNGEYALWQIDLELAESHPAVPRRVLIADVRDAGRLHALCAELRPELVFHAAALKHVPMVEANPLEGLLTNAAGTRHVADAARAAGAAAMVLISTDKAVNPSSLMGASKRLAEMYCQALDIAALAAGGGMRCVTVRFGNVLGSTGSVVPLFRRQLERGGPLTVTHPDMQRYFMTVQEAVGLVLQASVVGSTGGTPAEGGIFVLDMGPPVRIVDLARQMIRLAGLRPDRDVAIAFTGLRPGEKLFEELFHGREPPVPTGHAGLLMAAPRTADLAIVGRAIDEIAASARAGQARLALAQLGRMVPEFAHNPDGARHAASGA